MEAPSGVIYRVTSIPLCEYEITYIHTPPPPKRKTFYACCITWLFYYKTKGGRK